LGVFGAEISKKKRKKSKKTEETEKSMVSVFPGLIALLRKKISE
jgi:hypothetical protein